MIVRVHTNDGRTEDIHLDDGATIAELRRSIADAFVVVNRAGSIRIRVHEPFHERLRRRLAAAKAKSIVQSRQPEAVTLDDARSCTTLATLGVLHQSTIVVENCDELSSRPLYTVIRRLRSLKESEGGRQVTALKLLQTLMRKRLLEPDRISVPVEAVKPILEAADCYSVLSPLGIVLQGDRFLLQNVTPNTARQILYCLYGRTEWNRIESEEKAARIRPPAPETARTKFTRKPETMIAPNTMPDYSRRAFYVFMVVIAIGVLLAHVTRRYSEISKPGPVQEGTFEKGLPQI